MTRVHFPVSVLLLGLVCLQGCTTTQTPPMTPVYAHPAKIIRFADALGAVASNAESSKLQSMLAAFDYCDREQRLAFVTPPMAYLPHVNYSHVSTYSIRFSSEEAAASNTSAYIAPFECIEQKHSVKTGLLESEDVPTSALRNVLPDHRGGVIVHAADAKSLFQENDILVQVGSYRVESRAELVKAVDVSPVGPVFFGVIRDGDLIQIAGQITDTTASTQKNALHLLEALCKETGGSARSCATHASSFAQN